MDGKNESNEFVGSMPIRQDITVLPADDPEKLRLGWVIYEHEGPFMLPSDDNSCYDFNFADRYFGSHGLDAEPSRNIIWTVIPQLEFLWGQPWNNLALNYVMALRPSAIRVSNGCITLDCFNWRVTVYLEDDNRTIKRIEQECNAGSIGACCGHDLQLKLKQQVDGKKIEQFDASAPYINASAVAKIEIDMPNEDNKPCETKLHEHVGPVIINDYTKDKVDPQ